MTKKEIVKQISDKTGLTQLKTKEIVQWTFDAIIDTLLTEKRIELRNFGVFEVKRRKARRARNPRTGDRVDVEPKNVVTFQPGKEMEERVRQMDLVVERPKKPRRVRQAVAAAASDGRSEPTTANVNASAANSVAENSTPAVNGTHDDARKKKLKQ